MAKASGIGQTTLSVDNSSGTPVAIKNDVNSWSFSTPIAIQDVTGLDKFAIERLQLLRDFSITLNGTWDSTTSTTNVHACLSTITASSSPARTTTIVINAATMTNEVLYTDYAINRAASGELTWTAPGVLADGTIPAWS